MHQGSNSRVLVGVLGAVCSLLLAGACATVPEEEKLYTGANVEITRDSPVRGKRSLERELSRTVRPIPNTTWFGTVRPWLGVHYLVGDPGKPETTGIRSWIYDRFAEEPVLLGAVVPERTAASLEAWLFNHGYFEREVAWEVVDEGRTASVDYRVAVGEAYRIEALHWPSGEGLYETIRMSAEESLIRPGEQYHLETLRDERVRIDHSIKNDGYYAFSPDYLVFDARGNPDERTVSLRLTVRADTPDSARIPYTIGSITIYADYRPGETRDTDADRVKRIADNYRYVQRGTRYRSEVIVGAILFNPGDTYQRERHVKTIDRLMSLGGFRFVNIRYEQEPDTGVLHAEILLTPALEKTIEGEIMAVTRSDGFAGPGLSARYRDRNTFSGAETFSVDLNAGFETLIGTEEFSFDSYEIGLDTALGIPRVATPLGSWDDVRGEVMPRTTIRGSVSSLTRFERYRRDQFSTSLGYEWSHRSSISNDLRPFDITFVRHDQISPEFQSLLAANPILRSSFEEQFIFGASYRFLYNTRGTGQSARRYLYTQLDLAGNALSFLLSGAHDRAPNPDDPFTILGTRYSQFVRIESEARFSKPLSDAHVLAARLLGGVGYPLGNSVSLPRVKQFSLGGPSSVRAFYPRTVGPGTVAPEYAGGPAVERSGDVRIEANLEYRFRIAGILKGALFTDAGNIWSLDPDADAESGRFNPDMILEEVAVGAGSGIRIEPQFLVVRLDVAAPLRKPWLEPEERWVISHIDVSDRRWRRDNLVFNLAIGYPF